MVRPRARRIEVSIIAERAELKDWYAKLGFTVSEEAVSFEHLPLPVTLMVRDF